MLAPRRRQGTISSEPRFSACAAFAASHNNTQHADRLLREWQTIDPAIKHVTFVHGAPSAAPRVVAPGAVGQPGDAPKIITIRERLKAKRDAAGGATGC